MPALQGSDVDPFPLLPSKGISFVVGGFINFGCYKCELPHTLPQILSIIKAKALNEKVKKSEFITAFYLYIMQ